MQDPENPIPLPRKDRFKESVRPITEDDLNKLIELGANNLPVVDRNFIVVTSARDEDFPDRKTRNTILRRNYARDHLHINIDEFKTPSGEELPSRLVGEICYSAVACAKGINKNPDKIPLYLAAINDKVGTSRAKYNALRAEADKSGCTIQEVLKEDLTNEGVPFAPNEDPLSAEGLVAIWDALEAGLVQFNTQE